MFTISGRVPGVSQYVIGGFRVEEKIHMLEAFARFPEYRLREDDVGQVVGNIICNAEGHQDMLDHHDNFERRLDNYIIGRDPTVLSQPDEIQRGRDQTLAKISETMGKQGNRVIDIIGRMSKLDDLQAEDLLQWLNHLKEN